MFKSLAARTILIIFLAVCGFLVRPAHAAPASGAAGGVMLGLFAIWIESYLKRASFKRLVGGIAGGFLGLAAAVLCSLIIDRAHFADVALVQAIQLASATLLIYLGLSLGASKGDLLNLSILPVFGAESASHLSYKILDTSVIIDGRIADLADTGFLDGVLVIPQFVLRELQLVADSSDSIKRNRGRRGLDILQRIQKMKGANVRIVEDDFPQVREVDLKLIELAKIYPAKIVTNDFNLNKVAQLRGVEVLNINELANALKPIVLPGETMRVFILKEGKEYNQGVAYLDDGTMVVVDNAKRMISKTVDITVTSVLQTPAGKMIFGRHEDRNQVASADHRLRRDHAGNDGFLGSAGS